MILGIDASNVRTGGGFTHLTRLLDERAIGPAQLPWALDPAVKIGAARAVEYSATSSAVVSMRRTSSTRCAMR